MRDEVRHRRNWTRVEENDLRKMCEKGYNVVEISEKMGRNENAIRAKTSRLGYSLKGGEFVKRTGSKSVGTYTIRRKPWWKRIFGV